jgi:predicted nucleotide-binding protein (sugar kinase/HSP70/actin superfamily)
MGRTLTEAAVAVFEGFGIRARALPPARSETLREGRANCSCTECLPLILITGSLLQHLPERRAGDQLLWFVPAATGGCRMPQYRVHLERLILQRRIPGVAVLSLASAHGYAGLGIRRALTLLKAIIVADLMDDIRSSLRVLAADPGLAQSVFDTAWQRVLECFAHRGRGLYRVLRQIAHRLRSIPLAQRWDQTPKVLLAGEVFARKDQFSSQGVVDALTDKGIIVHRAPLVEWFHYVDYWNRAIDRHKASLGKRIEVHIRRFVQHGIENRIARLLARSGLCSPNAPELSSTLAHGERHVGHLSGGEAILVIGRYFDDLAREFDGMISIGPFGCLPTRVVEAILTPGFRNPGDLHNDSRQVTGGQPTVPFLSLETDGNPMPQGLETRLEAFCLQVRRTAAKRGGK